MLNYLYYSYLNHMHNWVFNLSRKCSPLLLLSKLKIWNYQQNIFSIIVKFFNKYNCQIEWKKIVSRFINEVLRFLLLIVCLKVTARVIKTFSNFSISSDLWSKHGLYYKRVSSNIAWPTEWVGIQYISCVCTGTSKRKERRSWLTSSYWQLVIDCSSD